MSSVFAPHGVFEASEALEHTEYEGFRLAVSINRLASYLKKQFQKIKGIFNKMFRLLRLASREEFLSDVRLALLYKMNSNLTVLYFISVQCSYFHRGKFKNNKPSDLLPLMSI